jgi:hypothetical protein
VRTELNPTERLLVTAGVVIAAGALVAAFVRRNPETASLILAALKKENEACSVPAESKT